MDNLKESTIKAIEGLPKNSTLEDIIYAVYVAGKVAMGIDAIEKGKMITKDQLIKILSIF